MASIESGTLRVISCRDCKDFWPDENTAKVRRPRSLSSEPKATTAAVQLQPPLPLDSQCFVASSNSAWSNSAPSNSAWSNSFIYEGLCRSIYVGPADGAPVIDRLSLKFVSINLSQPQWFIYSLSDCVHAYLFVFLPGLCLWVLLSIF